MRSYVAPVIEPPASETLSLVSVINFVLRNAVLILAGGIVFGVLMAIPSARKPQTYTAVTTFITEGEQPAGRLIFGGLSLPATSGKGPEFYVELMQSPAILGPLVESPIDSEPGRPRTLVERYAKGVKNHHVAVETAIGMVQPKLSTRISLNGIITLRVAAENPRLAAAIAKGVLDQVDDFNNNKRKSQASAERVFAEQRMVEVGAEVREAERNWRNFVERNRDIGRSVELQFEKDHLTEELTMKRSLYSSILQAHERAKMDEVRDSPRATVLQSPYPPAGPDRRSWWKYAILGGFLGMMLAAFLALTIEYFARIPKQSSPEASEFAALRAESTERLRRPFNAILSAVRKPRHPDNVS
jgi:uncharacterized protein involved in exopolysaccharide biosynthesis